VQCALWTSLCIRYWLRCVSVWFRNYPSDYQWMYGPVCSLYIIAIIFDRKSFIFTGNHIFWQELLPLIENVSFDLKSLPITRNHLFWKELILLMMEKIIWQEIIYWREINPIDKLSFPTTGNHFFRLYISWKKRGSCQIFRLRSKDFLGTRFPGNIPPCPQYQPCHSCFHLSPSPSLSWLVQSWLSWVANSHVCLGRVCPPSPGWPTQISVVLLVHPVVVARLPRLVPVLGCVSSSIVPLVCDEEELLNTFRKEIG
jgi:hypothetical protein